MISIYSIKSGALIRNVLSTDGEIMRGRGEAPCPDDFERKRWDKSARAWIDDSATAASYVECCTDDSYRADHGADSINQARRRLAVEARLWNEFERPSLCPMLIAEAAMRSITPAALAAVIIEKDQRWIDREIARKLNKMEK